MPLVSIDDTPKPKDSSKILQRNRETRAKITSFYSLRKIDRISYFKIVTLNINAIKIKKKTFEPSKPAGGGSTHFGGS